ncbi:hypothetical protein V1478_004058 [Vespula squamosa]|uniref:Uncharacterized protein n=1 Tax=Vespula squamosa TaxID=30214 RepID=A0ABD2BNK1_VESSQ
MSSNYARVDVNEEARSTGLARSKLARRVIIYLGNKNYNRTYKNIGVRVSFWLMKNLEIVISAVLVSAVQSDKLISRAPPAATRDIRPVSNISSENLHLDRLYVKMF